MKKVYTLNKRIKSNSHNSPCDENGHHWPKGQQFKLMPKGKQDWYAKAGETAFEQVGGEEVILLVPDKMVAELFEVAP